jgi:hypothetical protein
MAMRFTSKGIDFIICGSFMLGSFITRLLMRSRSALDRYTIHEKARVSPRFSLASRRNPWPHFAGRSSPRHS